MERVIAHVHQEPRSPRSVNPKVSPAYEQVILRCLKKDPAARWRSMAELGRAIVDSLENSLRASVMILLIILGSGTFSQVLAFSGASESLVGWATGFDLAPLAMVIIMFLIISFLGLFMDEVSLMMLTLPMFMPIALAMKIDLVWFGVILLMSLEIGLLSPPFGLILFVMQGVAPRGTTMGQVNRAALPYMGWQLLVVALILVFPPIATWLPGLMVK